MELSEQKRTISALENVAESERSTNEPNLAKNIQNLLGKSELGILNCVIV